MALALILFLSFHCIPQSCAYSTTNVSSVFSFFSLWKESLQLWQCAAWLKIPGSGFAC